MGITVENLEMVKFDDDDVNLDVRVSPNEDTVWLSQAEMAVLFDVDRSRISRHISRIYADGELDKESTYAENAQAQAEGTRIISRKVPIYNLDVIIAVGYRINGKRGTLFRKWATSVLREYMLKGYALNEKRVLLTDENYIHLVNRVDSMDDRLSKAEKKINDENPKERIFFQGQFYDALSFLEGLICKASSSLLLIDSYCDKKALDIISKKRPGVKADIYYSSKSRLSQAEIEAFNKQYGNLFTHITDSFHDRFLIIDEKEGYHVGASLNYVGRRAFEMSKILDASIIEAIKKELSE